MTRAVSSSVVLLWVASACLLLLPSLLMASSPSGAGQSSANLLDRHKRGFRNSALSTARGFGKRDGTDMDNFPAALQQIVQDRAVPASWLAEQVTRSPALAKLLVDRVVDANGDGLISQEELYQAL